MAGPNIELFGRDLRELDDFENLSPGGLTGEEIAALFSPAGAAGRRIVGKITTQRLADLLLAIGVFTALSVEDEAYSSAWNASLEVPTKNAVYDKIEAAIAALQPLDSDLTAIAALTTTSIGRSVLAAATAAAIATIAGVGTGDSPTHVALTLSNGQIVFPASQVPSAGANTLDDYEEGTWTPVLSFATPGDLSVVYSVQAADYTKVGRLLTASVSMTTTTFTHTTASGNLRITGLPFTVGGAFNHYGAMSMTGITKATYTNFVLQPVNGQTYLQVQASGSGVTVSPITTAEAATAVQKTINGTFLYQV
jgi:hypothetical protein